MGDALNYIEKLEHSVDVAPEWDGRTSAQAIDRIRKLELVQCDDEGGEHNED